MKCLKCKIETGADWKTLCLTHWKTRSIEEIRVQRQEKINRKVGRLLKKAERLEKEGELKSSALDQYKGDIAFFTQPAKRNSGFGRYREKLYEKTHKGFQLLNEAEELKEKAEYLQITGAIVKGDAERKRQEKREDANKLFKVGSAIYDFCFKEGVVAKVNKKTFTIKFTSGGVYTRDKSYFV